MSTNSLLPEQTSSTQTFSITPAMTVALTTAIAALNTAAGSGSLDSLSITQLQSLIAQFNNVYAIYSAGISTPQNLDLDAVNGVGVSDSPNGVTPIAASTIDGWNDFIVAVNDVATESDLNIALSYINRIIQNLTRAPG